MGIYKDIRPYLDAEVNTHILELLSDEAFIGVMNHVLDGDKEKVKEMSALLAKVHTRYEFQTQFICPLIEHWIINRTTNGVTYSGLEKLDKSKGYLFVSNHRDIILDSAIMNYLMAESGFNTTEIAIGDNLLIYDWIKHLVKLNGAFEVKRSQTSREFLLASRHMSNYMRESITQHNNSIWIAQREGRTKNGNDQTQTSLLKMFNLSNTKDFIEGFEELHIVPLAISYEREPCGISKVEELYKKKTEEGYTKTQKDDLMSMVIGLTRPKGRVHFAFGEPLNVAEIIADSTNANANLKLIADDIDKQIYSNYKLYPYSYLAADMLRGENKYSEYISDNCREKFNEMLDDVTATINNGDAELQKEMFIQMYAQPVLNNENA